MLEFTCHTAFFISIVIVQWADLIISKTRRNSLYHQGMKWVPFRWQRSIMWTKFPLPFFSLQQPCVEFRSILRNRASGLLILLSWNGHYSQALSIEVNVFRDFSNWLTDLTKEWLIKPYSLFFSSRWSWWTAAMPFSLIIFLYDEGRKFIIRRRPGGFIESETYY